MSIFWQKANLGQFKVRVVRIEPEPTTRGYVDFSIPRMREYLNSNADELMAWFG